MANFTVQKYHKIKTCLRLLCDQRPVWHAIVISRLLNNITLYTNTGQVNGKPESIVHISCVYR